jgi:hypothetical protein
MPFLFSLDLEISTMSYDGQTSRNHKFVQHYYGNAYTQIFPNMMTFHNLRRHTNTFGVTILRLQADAGYTATSFSYNFENTLGSSNHLTHRSMWYTNGTPGEKYYPHFSQGLASSRYFSWDNFANTTGNSQNIRTDWEI